MSNFSEKKTVERKFSIQIILIQAPHLESKVSPFKSFDSPGGVRANVGGLWPEEKNITWARMLYSVLVISTLADYAEDWGSWILGTRHTEWLCVCTGMQCNNNILGRQCDTLCCTHCQCVQRSGGGRWPRWHSPVVADRGRAQSTELTYPLSQFHQKKLKNLFALRPNHPKTSLIPYINRNVA